MEFFFFYFDLNSLEEVPTVAIVNLTLGAMFSMRSNKSKLINQSKDFQL